MKFNGYDEAGNFTNIILAKSEEHLALLCQAAARVVGVTLQPFPRDTDMNRTIAAEAYAQHWADFSGQTENGDLVNPNLSSFRDIAEAVQRAGGYIVRITASPEAGVQSGSDTGLGDTSAFYAEYWRLKLGPEGV